jgi:hypothetical protein
MTLVLVSICIMPCQVYTHKSVLMNPQNLVADAYISPHQATHGEKHFEHQPT